jgi:hypothetical protein
LCAMAGGLMCVQSAIVSPDPRSADFWMNMFRAKAASFLAQWPRHLSFIEGLHFLLRL